MPESTKPVLTVDLIDELDGALDRIAAVADLLIQVGVAVDPKVLRDQTISRAASLIENEASRIRRLLYGHEGTNPESSSFDP